MNKRSTEEYIILSVSGLIALFILPFVFIRAIQGDWSMVALDGISVVVSSAMFVHVWLSRSTHIARVVIALICVMVLTVTIYLKGIDNILWVYPALTALFFLVNPRLALIVATLFLSTVTAMLWRDLDLLVGTQFIISTLATVLFCYAFSSRMQDQQSQLTELASVDSLTGARNRRMFIEDITHLHRKCTREKSTRAALLMLDIDNFKQCNDTLGHHAGDDVLVAFTKVISERIRESDTLYRYGGEEFMVLLANTSQEAASVLAEDLRKAVEQHNIDQHEYTMTTSIGVAGLQSDDSIERWIERADNALYRAKRNGRNCCVSALDSV